MNKRIFAPVFILIIFFFILVACAKISAPTGGLRDKLPPVVVKSVPVAGTTNFRGNNISITFDEYVVLDNIADKFMVSPPMMKKPRVFMKGKSVNVEFEDILKDSTTYTFYFQDAIKDLNEGNILDNFQFVFSTGPVIDSLSVTGNVYNSFDLEVADKTQVLMYRELSDSAVRKQLPDYISRVDQNGYFRINNIREGKYRLFALKDDDNSKNYNLSEESFAFMDTMIMVTPLKSFIPVVKDTTTIKKGTAKEPEPVILKGDYQLIIFTAQKKDHYLTGSARDSRYHLIYTLSVPPDSMKFEFSVPGEGDDKFFIERSRNRDTLIVWLTDSTLYSRTQISTLVKYPFTDTLGVLGYKDDTIQMRFLAPRAPRVAKTRKPAFKVENNLAGGFLKPGESIVFRSETPFRQPDTSRIKLYDISETNRQRVVYELVPDNTNSCKYTFKAKLAQNKKYLFIADSASFGNIYSENSDSTGIKFSIRDPEQYSKLILNIKNCVGTHIIQILDNSEKLIREKKVDKDGKIEFPLLENGFYRLREISDLNNDGKWTTGDFDKGIQPEPVSYYTGEVELKTGWVVDQDWTLGNRNFKEQKLRAKPKTR